MLKKDFFILVIKLFGLYSMIIVLFNILPQNFSYVSSFGVDSTMILFAFAISILTVGLFIALLFFAPKIVSMLKLEQGFDSENIDFKHLSEDSIIKLSSIVVGGITVIDNLPSLISYTLFAFSSNNSGQIMEANEKFYWIASVVQILVGLLLIFNYKLISKILKSKSIKK
jgi:hypothetical protein